MFTGIVEATGKLLSLKQGNNGATIKIDAGRLSSRVKKGDSIAVDGVCLTVASKRAKDLSFDISAETLDRTNLHTRDRGDLLNLELPMTVNTLLSGHFVQGHIEGTGRVLNWHRKQDDIRLFVALPSDLLIYCVPKGSITFNGVSLTIASMIGSKIGVALIPYTLSHTNLDELKTGDLVNIETDVIGRYVVSVLKKSYDKRRT